MAGFRIDWFPPNWPLLDWLPLDCRFRHHRQASIPAPASMALRTLLGPKVSFRTCCLFRFPNPNMLQPPSCWRRIIAAHSQVTGGIIEGSDSQHKERNTGTSS
jgi:hypothetical protein